MENSRYKRMWWWLWTCSMHCRFLITSHAHISLAATERHPFSCHNVPQSFQTRNISLHSNKGDCIDNYFIAFVDKNKEKIKSWHDRCSHCDVLSERLWSIISTTDWICCCQHRRSCIQGRLPEISYTTEADRYNITSGQSIWRKAASHPSWRRIHSFSAGDNATTVHAADELICSREGWQVSRHVLSPQNCPFPWGIWTPSNTWSLGPTQVLNPNTRLAL